MTLAAARMAVEDAGLGTEHTRGPRTAVVIGTTMGEADVLEGLDHAWIKSGTRGVKRALIPKYGSTLLPIHVARARRRRGDGAHAPGRVRRRELRHRLRGRPHPRGRVPTSSSPAPPRSSRSSSSAASSASRRWPRPLPAVRPESPGASSSAKGGLARARERGARRRRGARPQGRGRRLRAIVRRLPHHRPHPDATGSIAATRGAIESPGITPGRGRLRERPRHGNARQRRRRAKVMRDVFGGAPRPHLEREEHRSATAWAPPARRGHRAA